MGLIPYLISFGRLFQSRFSLLGQHPQLLPVFLETVDVGGDFVGLRMSGGHQFSAGFAQFLRLVPSRL